MNALASAAVFAGGALWGSFFYTLALRFASGEFAASWKRALFSPSRCPACSRRVGLLYLIPLAGYFFTRRKCPGCGAALSPAYPAMEALYGLLALAVAHETGLSIYGVSLFFVAGLALCMAVIDVKTLTIPNELIILFVLLSLYPLLRENTLLESLYGLLLMFVFFLVVLLVFPGSFGGGDVKFAAAIGLFLGLELAVVALEGSLITGAVAGTIYAIKTGRGFRSRIPFGPFLFAGLMIALFFGRDILVIYYSVFF
jgi:prepilin signal peptidase PulO-like enzyme (type II secretory pathway)